MRIVVQKFTALHCSSVPLCCTNPIPNEACFCWVVSMVGRSWLGCYSCLFRGCKKWRCVTSLLLMENTIFLFLFAKPIWSILISNQFAQGFYFSRLLSFCIPGFILIITKTKYPVNHNKIHFVLFFVCLFFCYYSVYNLEMSGFEWTCDWKPFRMVRGVQNIGKKLMLLLHFQWSQHFHFYPATKLQFHFDGCTAWTSVVKANK